MSATLVTPELLEVRSHSVTANHHVKIDREECYPRLSAVWRGEAVTVEVEANRYEHSSGWSEWRIFARVVRFEDGSHGSETARQRLSDACRPIVEAWLDSDAYPASRQRAFQWAALKQLRECAERVYTRPPAQYAREFVATYEAELPIGLEVSGKDVLLAACDKLDEFGEALEACKPV